MAYLSHEQRINWDIYRFTKHQQAQDFADAQEYRTMISQTKDMLWEVSVHYYQKKSR